MQHLAKLQQDFQAYLMDESQSDAFIECIVNDKKVGAKKRLAIYKEAYRLRIIEALANAYPKLQALLGDDLFNKTAHSYIDQYPSTYRNMRWVGDKMTMHLNSTLPQHPVAAELATFEWALGLAFDAGESSTLQLQDLVDISPETWGDLCFTFQQSVQLLSLTQNVLLIWQALDSEATPPAVAQINEPCLVWRKQMNSHYRALEDAEYRAIEYMQTGANFGALCEYLQNYFTEEEATLKAAQYLSTWLNDDLIAVFTHKYNQ